MAGGDGYTAYSSTILRHHHVQAPAAEVAALATADLLAWMDTTLATVRLELADVERDLVELRELPRLKAWLRVAAE